MFCVRLMWKRTIFIHCEESSCHGGQGATLANVCVLNKNKHQRSALSGVFAFGVERNLQVRLHCSLCPTLQKETKPLFFVFLKAV